MKQELSRQKIVRLFLDNDILVSNDVLPLINNLSDEDAEIFFKKVSDNLGVDDFFVFDKILFDRYTSNNNFMSDEIQSNSTSSNKQIFDPLKNKVKVLTSYSQKSIKREVPHFVSHFRQRYKALEQILSRRKEVQNRLSILRIKGKKEKDTVSAIGMVIDINFTKNENMMITIEDLTGTINILVNKNRSDELFAIAKNIVFDEVIGIEGTVSNGVIFVNSIIFPDIPLTKELKKSPIEEYVVFISDLHFGSKNFLRTEFNRFLNWINGSAGDEKQKDIASKIKYLMIIGDLVDGVGIYPSQEEDLEFNDIYKQYDEFTIALKQIPEHIQIVIAPGNHDAVRIPEPQPRIIEEYCKDLYAMKNVTMVSSPSYVNIGEKENFQGFDVLIYHGFSFPYYADNVEFIRGKGGLEKPEYIMEMMLKKRHLAPSHTSNLYIPDAEKDHLIIDKVPDFFVTGHIHRTAAKTLNNITMLNCSCWIGQTPYQEKVGLKPQPARVPIVNLKTREIKILKFGKEVYTLEDNKK